MPIPLSVLTVEQLSQLAPLQTLHNTPLIARGLNILFGPSGSYKSFFMLDLALIVAQQAPVVYVAAEGSSGLHKRIVAWCTYNQQPAGQLYFICEEVNLRDARTVELFIETVAPLQPALIILDTLARCLVGGEENSAKDTGLAIHHCAMLQRALETSVALVHHTNRAERGERGSGAIRGAADAMIEIAPAGDGSIKVSCSKLKDDEPWEPYELHFRTVGNSGLLLPFDEADRANRLSPPEKQILEFLLLEVFESAGATSKQIMGALNLSERTIYKLLSNLKHQLLIFQGSKGDPYVLTPLGKATICKPNLKIVQSISSIN